MGETLKKEHLTDVLLIAGGRAKKSFKVSLVIGKCQLLTYEVMDANVFYGELTAVPGNGNLKSNNYKY